MTKTSSVPPSSSYAFWTWLERSTFKGNNKEFVDRLMKDNLAPRSIGPRTPSVLMNYVMRLIDSPVRRVTYEVRDIPTIWNLWNLWSGERDIQMWEKRSGIDLPELRGEVVEQPTA